MRKPRRVLLMLAALAGFAVSLLVPAAAQAAYYGSETDYAVWVDGPGVDWCAWAHTGVIACWKADGDLLYVKDTKADGYAAVLEWHYQDSDRNWRDGSCVNKLGAGNWGVCNKNFPEDGSGYMNGARYNSGNFVDRGSPTWIG